MKRTKQQILIGAFESRNIFYDLSTQKCYASLKMEEKKFQFKWLVVSSGLAGNMLLQRLARIGVGSGLEIVWLLGAIILTAVCLQLLFTDGLTGIEISEFNPKGHFGWDLFLSKTKDVLNVLLFGGIGCGVIMCFLIKTYLQNPNAQNLIMVVLIYLLVHLFLFSSNLYKRLRAFYMLQKELKHD